MLAVKTHVALVRRIHRDCSVAQHRLWTRRRDDNEFLAAGRSIGNRVANLIQLARDILVLHFEIRDRRTAIRTPIHNVLSAIDQPVFIQTHECFLHRARQVVVHGEIFAAPIDRRAEALHLVENRAAIFTLPLPDPLDKFLTAHLAPALAFFGKLALHHHLRGNAGMVRTGQPERHMAAHAVPADDDVHLRLVEHVAHMEPPGNVRGR